eukprot:28578-Pelagomonas_calceolata.AAC.1
MGLQGILKIWEVHQIGNGGGRFKCRWFCLFSSQPSDIVEGVAIWASARTTGLGQIVIFEASLVFSNFICAFIPCRQQCSKGCSTGFCVVSSC